jgi:hypothetical protein
MALGERGFAALVFGLRSCNDQSPTRFVLGSDSEVWLWALGLFYDDLLGPRTGNMLATAVRV